MCRNQRAANGSHLSVRAYTLRHMVSEQEGGPTVATWVEDAEREGEGVVVGVERVENVGAGVKQVTLAYCCVLGQRLR